ncbi:MAG: ABC transporter permease [Acidimicrobiia bacterium]
MDTFLSFLITGLATAAIYAIGASGLVLTYTTTGVFNFAHGAIGMMAAFLYWQLRFDWGWPAPIALVFVLLIAAPLFGAGLEAGLMRRLQGSNDATKLVVGVGLLAALIGVANWVWPQSTLIPGLQAHPDVKMFNNYTFSVFGTLVTYAEAIEMGCAILVAFGLWALLYRTRPGIAMRASVDDRALASLNGARPDRSAMLAWAIGCSLAAVSGVFFVGSIALDAGALSLLVVNVYAAAMIGRLRSLPLTFLGALVLGLVDSYLKVYSPGWVNSDYLGSPFISAVPVIVLFGVLLVLPQARLRAHGTMRTREFFPMPSWRGALFFAASVMGLAIAVVGLLTTSDKVTVTKVLALGIIGLSFVPLVGFAGQVSLCQLTFAGIGAVTMAHLGHGGNPIGLVVAVLIAATVGALIALPTLRLGGIYLALATAAFAVAMDLWIWALPEFSFFGHDFAVYGNGSLGVDRLKLFGVSFAGETAQLLLFAAVFSLLALFVVWLRRGPFGRRLLAMKDSEAACATVGMNLRGTKLLVFAISAGMAGLGGALYGGLLGSIQNRNLFDFVSGLPVFMMVVVGGVGAVGGALFAGVTLGAFTIIPSIFASIEEFLTNVFGVLPGALGITMGRNPNGVVHEFRDRFVALWRSTALLAALVAVEVGLRVLAGFGALPHFNGFTSSWCWVALSIVALFVFANVAEVREERARQAAATAEDLEEVPFEWVGIETPFTPEYVRALDRQLALAEVVPGG